MSVENAFAPLLQNTSLHRHYVYGKSQLNYALLCIQKIIIGGIGLSKVFAGAFTTPLLY